MMRIGMTVAALWVSGGVLLAPGEAQACEAHAQAAARPAATKDAAKPGPAVKAPLEELDAVMAAKCQCGSAADCTCKKGTCQCARCKKPRRQVVDALRGETPAPKVLDARHDASAGIFI